MIATLYATTRLVAVALLKHVLGASNVDTQLPADQTSWAATGFVQVIGPTAGEPNEYGPVEAPVLAVRSWACAPGGRRPPWNQAEQLAERVHRLLVYDYTAPVTVTLPAGYEQAIVDTAYLMNHPTQIGGDDSAFACFGFDVRLSWRGLGLS